MEIRKLRPEDDLGRAAEILFQADPYIMPDLLCDREIAGRVGGCLFSEDEEQLFCFDRTLVAVQDGTIQGILCYRTGVCRWDEQSLRDEYTRKGRTLPVEFERVNREYFAKVANAELPPDSAECMFLAVDSAARGKGIGKALLSHWIRSEKSTFYLDVLENNGRALHLYNRLGFKQKEQHCAYPAALLMKCHTMFLSKNEEN